MNIMNSLFMDLFSFIPMLVSILKQNSSMISETVISFSSSSIICKLNKNESPCPESKGNQLPVQDVVCKNHAKDTLKWNCRMRPCDKA